MSLAGLGLLGLLASAGAPLEALAIPAVALGAIACAAKPAAALTAAFACTGFIGTIIAYLGLPAGGIADFVLFCLWIAVAAAYLTGRTRAPLWLMPGLLLPAAYLLLTAIAIFTSDAVNFAFDGFRGSAWGMTAILLLAIAPWPRGTFRRMARGAIAVALAVGAYAAFRYVVGQSQSELELARASLPMLPVSSPLRFFGSFLSAHQLAAWCATTAPFVLAAALVWRGWWRWAAIAAMGLCAFAIFASDVRTGLVAALVGIAVVLFLFQLAQAFPARRVIVGLLSAAALVLMGIGGYAATVAGSGEQQDRFSRILDPTDDPNYQARLFRWEQALSAIDQEPLGHGLGTQGFVGQSKNPDDFVGPINIDSSYLKIGIEQGFVVMALFILGLVVLLVDLARRSCTVRDPERAALGLGACGTLAAFMMMMYAGLYIEGVTAFSAWLLIGIGVAQFSSARATEHEEGPSTDSGTRHRQTNTSVARGSSGSMSLGTTR